MLLLLLLLFMQINDILEASSIWRQYKHQKHDLFLNDSSVAGYLTGPTGVAGYLTAGSASSNSAPLNAPPPLSSGPPDDRGGAPWTLHHSSLIIIQIISTFSLIVFPNILQKFYCVFIFLLLFYIFSSFGRCFCIIIIFLWAWEESLTMGKFLYLSFCTKLIQTQSCVEYVWA